MSVRPITAGSTCVSRALVTVSPTGTRARTSLLESADNEGSSEGPPSDAELSLDLQARIKELGLDEANAKMVDTISDSSRTEIDVEARDDSESDFIYVGGERFYLPSSARASRPTAIDSKERYVVPRRESFNTFEEVTSRRELLQEARPGIIGSLEGLALALSLFFILTIVATGGKLFAPFESVSSSSSPTTLVPRQRIVLDPDTLLKEDFARDGSSVFYGQAVQKEKDP